MLDDYIAGITFAIDRYSATAFVVEARVTVELRPGGQCYLEGGVTFADRSVFHFREFLDQTGSAVGKLMYVYHYRSETGELLFRYDNARHRPALPFEEHKHSPIQVTFAPAPELAEALEEAARLGGWL